MKTCNKCGKKKPFSKFYKRQASPDGYRHTCKSCCAARHREWSAEGGTQKRLAWERANPDKIKRKKKDRKGRARQILQEAVADGRILKPTRCHNCGKKVPSPSRLEGHHPDYTRPLAVEWLCRACHAAIHV